MDENILKLHNAARAVIEGQYRLLAFLYAKCSFHLGDLKAIQVMELENADLVKKYSDLALKLGIPPENYFKEATTSDASGVVSGANVEREVTEPEKPAEDKPIGQIDLNITVNLAKKPDREECKKVFVEKTGEFVRHLSDSLTKLADNWKVVNGSGNPKPINIVTEEPALSYFVDASELGNLIANDMNVTFKCGKLCQQFYAAIHKFANEVNSVIIVNRTLTVEGKSSSLAPYHILPDSHPCVKYNKATSPAL